MVAQSGFNRMRKLPLLIPITEVVGGEGRDTIGEKFPGSILRY
jgi:hypothetical protein